jgi:carbon-monoxide dehydrogenase medium subunit
LVTASPANDTIPPLIALGAELTLTSKKGIRHVPISGFYTGVRKTVLDTDEVVTEITFPAMKADQKGTFIKLGLRRAQAISLVSTALVLQMEADTIKSAAITLGAVAPTVIHAPEAEEFLVGKRLVDTVIEHAANLASMITHPITDIRGSAEYRKAMVKILVRRALFQLKDGTWQDAFPEKPVLLSKDDSRIFINGRAEFPAPIHTKINGKEYIFSSGYEKNLLHLIRENAGLTGTKEGCGEGECGACTIHLNGQAVMACLIPAPCADGADITTIEGLSTQPIDRNDNYSFKLHPVQRAFIDYGAVQCGYCTPGFIMSASILVDEIPHPTREQVTQGLTGNLCRCTGYYRIIEAVEEAVKQ